MYITTISGLNFRTIFLLLFYNIELIFLVIFPKDYYKYTEMLLNYPQKTHFIGVYLLIGSRSYNKYKKTPTWLFDFCSSYPAYTGRAPKIFRVRGRLMQVF